MLKEPNALYNYCCWYCYYHDQDPAVIEKIEKLPFYFFYFGLQVITNYMLSIIDGSMYTVLLMDQCTCIINGSIYIVLLMD